METGKGSLRPRILVIGEDSPESQVHVDLIRGAIPEVQIEVLTLEKKGEAEDLPDLVALGRRNFSVVVVDVSSRMSSQQWLEGLRREQPGLAVVLMVEEATVDGAVEAMRLGAEDFLVKPCAPDRLPESVKRALARREVFKGSVGEEVDSLLAVVAACQTISATLDPRRVIEVVRSAVARLVRSPACGIAVLSRGAGTDSSSWELIPPQEDASGEERALHELLEIALATLKPERYFAGVDESHFFHWVPRGSLTPPLFLFRFLPAGEAPFFAVALSPEKESESSSLENPLRLLRSQVELTARSIEKFKGVQSLVFVDEVTGLFNTRSFKQRVGREIESAKASGRSFSILFVDADHFKSVNDRYGHPVGSLLLKQLGLHLKMCVREADTVFRYGGDEFVALLSGADLATARGVAERIRASIEKSELLKTLPVSELREDARSLKITVSIGVAVYPRDASSEEAILRAADEAMYGAKRAQRNCVVIAEDLVAAGGGSG